MKHIVLSGGPSSGKTTSLSKIESTLRDKLGMTVLVCSETPTELILSGIIPNGNVSMDKFQDICMRKQLEKEKFYRDMVDKYFDSDNTVILYDRGILDQLAYCNYEVFDGLLKNNGMEMSDVIGRYDLIIHLVTAAKGTDFYTTANNIARKETAVEAVEIDDRTLLANSKHHHLKVVYNSVEFDDKVNNVVKLILNELGQPLPLEIERKFLIEKPANAALNSIRLTSKSDIIQTYLVSKGDGCERRIRQRGTAEQGYNFYYTEKIPISGVKRIEKEKKITAKEYIRLLSEADNTLHQIKKTRYCFIWGEQYFELDVYPFDDKYSILEIELVSEADEVDIPAFINVVKEVTNDDEYKNINIARTLKISDEVRLEEREILV